jgi:hypothetical protein
MLLLARSKGICQRINKEGQPWCNKTWPFKWATPIAHRRGVVEIAFLHSLKKIVFGRYNIQLFGGLHEETLRSSCYSRLFLAASIQIQARGYRANDLRS